ncbi:DedA family protein [Synechococcus elongatus]|uniref:DedA family protein n=1 Tax=Synechococcus elongatus PCC 11801 TaxID=2219813 RepID=A0AAN1UVD8_SYNEL|nr:DedA family protein [Synechococcus elongatus]AZB73540.1 DedA family protein [Synechococcus elongatus PCC 11801]
MDRWIDMTMDSLGYWGIGLLMFLENLFPPIPSELIMPLAGYSAAQGQIALLPAIVAGVVGTMVGALPWYYLGRWLGEDRILLWLERHGRWLGIRPHELQRSRRWFNRHGRKIVFWGRLIPGIRTLISLPAGFERMRLREFLIYSTLGTTIWVLLLTLAGYKLRRNFALVEQWLAPVSKGVAALLLVLLLVWLGRRWWLARQRATVEARRDR